MSSMSSVPLAMSACCAVLWVLGYRVAAAAQVTESTRRFLFLSVESGSDVDAPTIDPQPMPSPGVQ